MSTTYNIFKSKRLEEYIGNNLRLDFNRTDSEKMDVIDRTKPPRTFVEFFFDEMMDSNIPDEYCEPPTQALFANAFYSVHDGKNFTEEYRNCWIRRAQVTYPSLIRDMHFAYLLDDYNELNGEFDSIEYDAEKDIKEGADAIIQKGAETYYINLYVDTDKSRTFLEEKKDHRHPDNSYKEIHIPMKRNDERNTEIELLDGSNIWLYSREHIQDIVDAIESDNVQDRTDI